MLNSLAKGIATLFSQNSRLRLFAFVTLAAAAVISFTSLRDLASYAGFGERSWLLPLCVDAVAGLGMEVWLSGSRAWRSGRNLAMAAILGSLAGNGGDWWIKSASLLSAGLGLVPPAALAAVLLVLHRHWRVVGVLVEQASAPTPAPAPVQAPDHDRPAVTASRKVVTKSQPAKSAPAKAPKAADADKIAQLVQHARENGDKLPTRREAQALLREWNGVGVGTDKATALLAAAQREMDRVRLGHRLEEPVQLLPEPVQLHTVRDESDSPSAREEAML